ncbi:pyridoxamine 5'-phosphate oxidase family protein [Roseateles cavernae]|uniref:pyridoxamine 5'-phosphate oxidase family protein n=1 Tax=Roseateles cavernae TaxID=3153578 RepID=UPI0032E4D6F6
MTTEAPPPRLLLWELIKDIRFAMLTTLHDNSHLHSRPMTTQNRKLEDDDCLWFFMSRSGEPVDELTAEAMVNLAYADPDQDRYVSVSGCARVVSDIAKARELWSPQALAWFPGGVDDPDLALVEVKIIHAHYWDMRESKLTQLYTMAKAVVTGRPPTSLGESGEIRLR